MTPISDWKASCAAAKAQLELMRRQRAQFRDAAVRSATAIAESRELLIRSGTLMDPPSRRPPS